MGQGRNKLPPQRCRYSTPQRQEQDRLQKLLHPVFCFPLRVSPYPLKNQFFTRVLRNDLDLIDATTTLPHKVYDLDSSALLRFPATNVLWGADLWYGEETAKNHFADSIGVPLPFADPKTLQRLIFVAGFGNRSLFSANLCGRPSAPFLRETLKHCVFFTVSFILLASYHYEKLNWVRVIIWTNGFRVTLECL